MQKLKGTICQTGNSYAIRVPKLYIDRHDLKLKQHVVLSDQPVEKQRRFDAEAFWQVVAQLQGQQR
jgi:antitoxin component of MazEF toxin-antitoxin module